MEVPRRPSWNGSSRGSRKILGLFKPEIAENWLWKTGRIQPKLGSPVLTVCLEIPLEIRQTPELSGEPCLAKPTGSCSLLHSDQKCSFSRKAFSNHLRSMRFLFMCTKHLWRNIQATNSTGCLQGEEVGTFSEPWSGMAPTLVGSGKLCISS